MASGSSKGFDFASDDILCSYEDYANQEQSNGTHSDSAIATKEFNKSRMARTSVFPNSSYSPPDDSGNQEVIIMAVERSMKKHTDNVMRFLEGLSSRLSQLELYCYNLDKSIGEMRSDLTRDHGESDAKLKFLEKHVQEVHRSVQILRDKQELADTQKELAKLQLAQKESSSSSSQQNDEGTLTPDAKKKESSPESHGQQLALVPAPQPQPQAYYIPGPAPPQGNQTQYPQSQPPQVNQTQYPQSQLPPTQPPQVNQTQYPPAQPPQVNQTQYLPTQPPQVNQTQYPPTQPQYQQQWTPQVPPPQPGMQPGSRPVSPQVYPQYLMNQPVVNPSPEPVPNSMPMQMQPQPQPPYSAIPPPGSSQPVSYSYGGPVRGPQPPPQQAPPQHMKPGYGGPPGDGYGAGGSPNAYMMYDNESGRSGQFYPASQQGGGGGRMGRQQFMPNHPYNELVDKLVSMGYRGDHVMSVIQRLDESGQTVDFNAVLDKLNGHPPGQGQGQGQRGGWSG